MKIIRKSYTITGQVQGVGFRPFVYRLAHKLDITGFISNNKDGVYIEAQASIDILQSFRHSLEENLPQMACITTINESDIDIQEEKDFIITASEKTNLNHSILIGADMAHCEDCKKELFDPRSRHYLYPFINCTNCGARYSITHSLPYDREKTSMACFPLCDECKNEYNNPLDRRFHAQPTACQKCGVELWTDEYKNIDAIKISISRLNTGSILAIKGIGGFHLACNAFDDDAIQRLRNKKNRPHKALAIMVKDIENAKLFVEIDQVEANLLSSPRRPIVLCKKKSSSLSSLINQDTNTIGIMLPSSPLHEMLFSHFDTIPPLKALVMTSGNSQSKPLAIKNRDATKMLSSIADYFLFHNRDILVRVDDSVIMPKAKEIRHLDTSNNPFLSIRRARGYVPEALIFTNEFNNCNTLLALGSDLKASACIIKENKAFVSQHIGNMENVENQNFMLETIGHMQNILAVEAKDIVIDAHPNTYMRAYAEEYTTNHNSTLYKVQHHIAHTYALLADNNIFEPLCVLALDGTGYGLDNTMWGGELFFANPCNAQCSRIGSFSPIMQPAFDTAVKKPYYMLVSYLYNSTNPLSKNNTFLESHGIDFEDKECIEELCKANMGVLTSSCGRLFDAIGTLCHCNKEITYEGQTAMQLEAMQDITYTFYEIVDYIDTNSFTNFNSMQLFDNCLNQLAILEKEEDNMDNAYKKLASYFHLSLAHSLAHWLMAIAKEKNTQKIGLTGGVFLNTTLLTTICIILEKNNFLAIIHQNYSCTDASISLGQAYFVLCKKNVDKI